MIAYMEAVEQSITPNKPESEQERFLIWLAAINENLPNGKRLGDTEMEQLAQVLYVATWWFKARK